MKRAIEQTNRHYETASNRTPEYLEWHRTFKREMKKFLESQGATRIEIGSPNHFDMSGFFTARNNQMWYFRIEDIRWSKENILIRTARSYTDYTGGHNQYISLASEEAFKRDFASVMTVGVL